MTFLLLSQSILSPNGAVPVPPRFVPVVDRATAHHNGGACDFAVDQTGDPVSGAPMLSGVRDDLFGAWPVDMSYARIGTTGRSKSVLSQRSRTLKKGRGFDDAHIARRGSNLDERLVAAKRDPRTFERLDHENWARCCRRTCESDQVEICQSLASLRDARARQIALRCAEREASFAQFAKNSRTKARPRYTPACIRSTATTVPSGRWIVCQKPRKPVNAWR